MTTTPLGKYFYTYAADSGPNRQIQFIRTDEFDPKTIQAVVLARVQGEWKKKISTLEGKDINVEMECTSRKIAAIQAERLGQPYTIEPDKKLSELDNEQQQAIFNSFEPKGDRRIGMVNDVGEDPRFEKIVCMNIYDPS